jgi:hypothetical protein
VTASIVVTNHDHGRFLAQAIDSALAQTHTAVEVVVVDDGSTDDSRRIIDGYGDALRVVLREHGGQARAMLDGFRRSCGEVVLFLDGDDLLYHDAVSRIAARFDSRIAKVQGRLDLIDDRGQGLGRQTPPLAMPSGDLLPVVLRHGWYPAPPTTGNAFARATLEALLPVPESYAGLSAADGRLSVSDHYLSVLAPFQGRIVSLPEPIGAYRIHAARRSRQRSALLAEVRRRIERTSALSGIVRQWAGQRRLPASLDLALGTPNHVKERLASLVLDPLAHPVPSDQRWALVRAGLAAAWSVPWSPLRMRIAQSLGFVALATLPSAAVDRLLFPALVDHGRPRWLSRLAGMEV